MAKPIKCREKNQAMTTELRRSDFDYFLPPELVAQQPLAHRGDSRMLCVSRNCLSDGQVIDFPSHLRKGDLLVLNDTKVIAARLRGSKLSGGSVQLLIERLIDPVTALAHARPSSRLRPGSHIRVGSAELLMEARDNDLLRLRLVSGAADFEALLATAGEVPLPPYIQRRPDVQDSERYQTVYARSPGAVAAPTAGLHFDRLLLERIEDCGVEIGYVTLHVGAGTFQPVREDAIERHRMHSEQFDVSSELVSQVDRAHARGGRVIAVGTTVVRALESSVAGLGGSLKAQKSETQLFIVPGFRFQVVDALLTNFHLPKSTLLMLVSAFAGHQRVMAAYRHAVAQRYRFFSYGDAMWIPERLTA